MLAHGINEIRDTYDVTCGSAGVRDGDLSDASTNFLAAEYAPIPEPYDALEVGRRLTLAALSRGGRAGRHEVGVSSPPR